eukprot:500656-Rhodomonas_salina.1
MFLRAGPGSLYVKPSSNEPRKYCNVRSAALRCTSLGACTNLLGKGKVAPRHSDEEREMPRYSAVAP